MDLLNSLCDANEIDKLANKIIRKEKAQKGICGSIYCTNLVEQGKRHCSVHLDGAARTKAKSKKKGKCSSRECYEPLYKDCDRCLRHHTQNVLLRNISRRFAEEKHKWNIPGKYQDYLGCTGAEFMKHLEANFKPGMAWENRVEKWGTDHTLPLRSFDLTKKEECLIAFNYKNQLPMWNEEHKEKSRKENSRLCE